MSLVHLIYTSFAVGRPSQSDLEKLLKQAREHNELKNITGMLLYRNNVYLQVLEGDRKDVRNVFSHIQHDRRNQRVTKLLEEPILNRDFPDWSMGFHRIEDDSPVLDGWSGIFNSDHDPQILVESKTLATNLILGFAHNT